MSFKVTFTTDTVLNFNDVFTLSDIETDTDPNKKLFA